MHRQSRWASRSQARRLKNWELHEGGSRVVGPDHQGRQPQRRVIERPDISLGELRPPCLLRVRNEDRLSHVSKRAEAPQFSQRPAPAWTPPIRDLAVAADMLRREGFRANEEMRRTTWLWQQPAR